MSPVFADARRPPDDADLDAALGPNKARWDELLAHISAAHPELVCEWKFYGAKHGWQFKVSDKRRAILYAIPKHGTFTASLALDDAGVKAAQASSLPAPLIAAMLAEPVRPEGRAARVEVSTKAHVQQVERLLSIKRGR